MKKQNSVLNMIAWLANCQWLTPVILAAWEAEIRRIWFKASLGK
jgi:hypothetical protein